MAAPGEEEPPLKRQAAMAPAMAPAEEPTLKRDQSSTILMVPQLVDSLFDTVQQEYNSTPGIILRKDFLDFCLTHLKFELDESEISRTMDELDLNDDQKFDKQEINKALTMSQLLRLKVRNFLNGKSTSKFLLDDYDFGRTTVENYKADWDDGVQEMHGKQRLEFKGNPYFQNYSLVRQKWQDEVVQQAAIPVVPRKGASPWLIYTCGTPGAGKGFVMSWLSDQDFFPLETVVHVDPDNFKMHMPEWPKYKANGETSVDKVCGAEANFLADLTQEVALSHGHFVWRDTTLLAADRIMAYMKGVRQRLPHYKIAVFYIFADEEIVRQRIKAREAQTGRSVTDDFLEASFANIKKSLTTVQTEVDMVAMVDNSGRTPEPILSSYLEVDRKHNWGRVAAQFST